MPTKYIVTLVYVDRTYRKHTCKVEEVREVLEKFFKDENVTNFVVTVKEETP